MSRPDGFQKVLAVIVLYERRLNDSPAFHSLVAATRESNTPVVLFVWDNSPEPRDGPFQIDRDLEDTFVDVVTHAAPSNPGLVQAYNAAFEIAQQRQIPWLLTLDQDTELPDEYLSRFQGEATSISDAVGACVPLVQEGQTACSPVAVFAGLPWQFLPVRSTGPSLRRLAAINSGAFVRVALLDKLGGYSTDFTLDFVDHWLCRAIYDAGGQIYVLPVTIEHKLSVNSFMPSVSLGRYQSILAAQRQYVLTDHSLVPAVCLSAALPLHVLKKTLQGVSLPYIKAALTEWGRLLWSIPRRLGSRPSGPSSH